MSEDREHKPAKRQPLPPPFAEPGITPSLFFTMHPVSTGGEIVVPQHYPLNEQQPWPSPPQQAAPVINQRAGQGSDQQPQAPPQRQGQPLAGLDREQLQRLCRHLRRTGGCPGECVLSRSRRNRRLRRFPGMG